LQSLVADEISTGIKVGIVKRGRDHKERLRERSSRSMKWYGPLTVRGTKVIADSGRPSIAEGLLTSIYKNFGELANIAKYNTVTREYPILDAWSSENEKNDRKAALFPRTDNSSICAHRQNKSPITLRRHHNQVDNKISI